MPNPQTSVFPGAVVTDNTLMVATNRALTTLTFPIDGSQTSFTVVNSTVFNSPCIVQIDTEIIAVGAISGSVLQSCTRGFSGTAATSHGQNANVKGYVFAYHHNQVAAEIKAIEAGLGENLGNVVTQADQAGGDMSGPFSNLVLGANAATVSSVQILSHKTLDPTCKLGGLYINQAGQTGSISNTNVLVNGSTAPLGFYRVSASLNTTTIGLTGTVSLTIQYTGNGIARTVSFLSTSVTTLNVSGATYGEMVLYTDGSANIVYSTTLTSTGTPQYALQLSLERLG